MTLNEAMEENHKLEYPRDDDTTVCGAELEEGFFCTLYPWHSGHHAAQAKGFGIIRVWDRDDDD